MNEPKEKQGLALAIAWYRPEQWQRIRAISADGEDMEDTYEEWLQLAEQRLAELQAAGLRVEKVDLHSEELILWCNERGLEINGQARSHYAAEKLREKDRDVTRG